MRPRVPVCPAGVSIRNSGNIAPKPACPPVPGDRTALQCNTNSDSAQQTERRDQESRGKPGHVANRSGDKIILDLLDTLMDPGSLHVPVDLLDPVMLRRPGMSAVALQVDDLRDALLAEELMAPPCALVES